MSENQSYDYLIIGADAAGLSAAVQIRGNKKEASIGILERGEIISYGACGLPYAIEKKIEPFDKLIHFTPEKFSDRYKADIHTSTEAIHVDEKQNQVTATTPQGEKTFSYTTLMIATGANPIRLPGIDYSSDRVFELKTVPDGQKIQEALKKFAAQHAIIIGAGYIGLELADVLTELGIQVSVVDAAEGPVPRMPEEIGSAIVKKMEAKGIQHYFGEFLEEAQSTGDSVKVKTSGQQLEGDILITGVGVRPATEFLEGTTIKMDRGAIVVDSAGKTSVENIYAGGDCATVPHYLLEGKSVYMPLGSTANKQGRIAGMNMSGESIHFPGILGTQIFKFFDLALAQTGLDEASARKAGYDPITVHATRPDRAGYYPGASKITAYLVIDQKTEKILGGHLVGSEHASLMIDTIAAMAHGGMKAHDAAYFDAGYAPPFSPVWSAVISAAGKFGRMTD